MSQVKVRYEHGFNVSGTGQHEVLEYVVSVNDRATCRCVHPEHHTTSAWREEGPYVALYTETPWAAQAIAALLNADGTDNNFPTTPLSAAKQYAQQRFGPWGGSRMDKHLEATAQEASGFAKPDYPNGATELHD